MDLVLQHVGDLPPLDSTPLLVSADLRRVPRSQDRYLATHIAACEREHRGAEVVSLFGADPSSLHPSVQAIISRQYCLYGCGLIYLPCLPPTRH